ncbi:MAG: DUF1579 domain-containing protein [Planctomycetota bacterium]
MKKLWSVIALLALSLGGAAALRAQDPGALQQETRLLPQLVGEWDYVSQLVVEAGKPPLESRGTERVRAVGACWVVAESESKGAGGTYTGVMTVGYDARKQKHMATFIDSLTTHMTIYEGGSLDERGRTLTLLGEAPGPGGTIAKYRCVIERKGRDQRTLTSAIQLADGTWADFLSIRYTRKR